MLVEAPVIHVEQLLDYEVRPLTSECSNVQVNSIRSRQLRDALEKLNKAIREVEAVVETMQG